MNLIPIVMILPLVTAVTTLQAEFCNVRPLRYSYRNGSFTHGEPMTQCTSLPNNYLDCPPSVITDGNTGPTNFDDSIQQQPYFIWNNTRSEEILFTFPRTFNLTRIVIFFYFRYSDIGLRKLRFYLVDNDFDIATNESIDRIPGRTVGPYPSNSTMKKSSNILLTGSTSKILMQVETNKKFKMVMSEIQFCTNDTTTATTHIATTSTTDMPVTSTETDDGITDGSTTYTESGTSSTKSEPLRTLFSINMFILHSVIYFTV